jgi:AraC family transcriptional regulator
LQQREEHWAIVDLVGKGGHIRTVPLPEWVKRPWMTGSMQLTSRAGTAEIPYRRNTVRSNSPHLGKITLQERAGEVSLMQVRYAPGVRLAAHSHEKVYFVWIQNGAYAEAFGTQVYQLRARQVLFRPAGEKHSDEFSSVETSCFIIEVSETWLDLVRECGRLRSDPFVSLSPQMCRLASDLYFQAQHADSAAGLAMEGLSYALGAELVRESRPNEGAHPPAWLTQLHELLSADPCGDFALADLASLVGIHPVNVSRQFRRYYGEPLWDYLRRRRIEIGAQKLLSGWGTVCEIAHSLGFSDHAQFTRTFKRFMGVTPSEFRFRQRSAQSERRLKLR